jgi:hypothetical protein
MRYAPRLALVSGVFQPNSGSKLLFFLCGLYPQAYAWGYPLLSATRAESRSIQSEIGRFVFLPDPEIKSNRRSFDSLRYASVAQDDSA